MIDAKIGNSRHNFSHVMVGSSALISRDINNGRLFDPDAVSRNINVTLTTSEHYPHMPTSSHPL